MSSRNAPRQNDPMNRFRSVADMIPEHDSLGRLLTQEEREEYARRKGVCLRCGIRTHDVRNRIFKTKGLTNDEVYHGICIRDNKGLVPEDVYQKWEQQFRPIQAQVVAAPTNRLRVAGDAVVGANRMRPPSGPGGSGGSREPTSGSGSSSRPASRHPPASPRVLQRNGGILQPSHAPVSRSHSRMQSHESRSPSRTNVSSSSGSLQSAGSGRPVAPRSSSNDSSGLAVSVDPAVRDEDYRGGDSNDDPWAIVRTLRSQRDQIGLIKQKLHRLRNLGDDQGACALYEIKDLMDFHRDDSRVLAACAGAIWGIAAAREDKRGEAADSGAIAGLLDGMRSPNNQRDVDFLIWGVGCLSCLARGPDNKGIIGDLGGIEVILDCMTMHPNSAGIFEWSCRALHALVYMYDDEVGDGLVESTATAISKNVETLAEGSGISAIVRTMKKHVAEGIAQSVALNLLWRLQDTELERTAKRVLGKIIDEEGLHVCVQILKARSTSMQLYGLASSLLYNLIAVYTVNHPTVPEEVVECLSTTLRMMRDYHEDEVLHEACCMLVAALAPHCRLQVKESNGLSEVVNSMSRFPTNRDLQEACSQTLWTMSYIPVFFDYNVVGEALRTLKVAIEANPDAVQLQTNACAVIANVVAANSGQIGSTDIPVEIPVAALSSSSDDAELARESGRALSAICSSSANLAAKLVNSGALPALWRTFESASGPAALGVMDALVSIARTSDDNKRTLLDADILAMAKQKVQQSSSVGASEKALVLMATVVATEKRPARPLPNDVFVVIIQALRTQLTSPQQRQLGCDTLRNLLIVSTPGSPTLMFDGLVEFMCELINDRPNPVELKRDACSVIWALMGRHAKQSDDTLSSVFRSIVGVMSLYRGEENASTYNADLQEAAVGAMTAVSFALRDVQVLLTGEDVQEFMTVLYMVLDNDLDNIGLLTKFLECIYNISLSNEGIVIQCGGIVAVIDTMVDHEPVESIIEHGCSILALMSSTENLQVNLCIAETDGIDMIINALGGFQSNRRIQMDSCKALSHLSVDQESRVVIASEGGILLLVNAINNDKENVELLEGACAALLNLSSDAEESYLADAGVVNTIVNVMRSHVTAPKLQEKALGVMQNISMRNHSWKGIIAEAGGITTVTAAIREFLGSPTVLERAFTTMWSLAVLEQNQIDIANVGGIDLVVNGMMANIDYEKVQKQACGCLCTLSSHSRNKTLIRDAGGVEAIVYAMWAHYNSEVLQIEACRALSSLAVNVQTNEVMLATDGEINAIVSAMRRFSDSAKLQEHACVALRNFTLSSDNAVLIRTISPEVIDLIQRAADRFPQRCMERGNQVLASLG